jgi:NAD(P)-dependent dehydrogenase (short-subunit alcohol dehydrogenase family)
MEDTRPVALVTGAGRGIGRAAALELASSGFDIAGVARTFDLDDQEKGLFEVKEQVEAGEAHFLPLQGDIADLEVHERILAQVVKAFGRIDILVNNAGVAPQSRLDVLETTADSFDHVLSVNLRGTFFLTQQVARLMLKFRQEIPGYRPKVVFITSVSAVAASTNRPEYCISKAGLSMAAQLFALRLAGSGIGVYEIRPGIIATDMTAPVKDVYDRRISDGLVPQNRWGQPEDIGRAVAAIVGGAFDYATGIAIELSGGLNIRHL